MGKAIRSNRKHYVHVYAVIRVKVEVAAQNHQDAMAQADSLLFGECLAVRLTPSAAAVLDAEYAGEVTGYLVDEAGDTQCRRSCSYDSDHQQEPPTNAKV